MVLFLLPGNTCWRFTGWHRGKDQISKFNIKTEIIVMSGSRKGLMTVNYDWKSKVAPHFRRLTLVSVPWSDMKHGWSHTLGVRRILRWSKVAHSHSLREEREREMMKQTVSGHPRIGLIGSRPCFQFICSCTLGYCHSSLGGILAPLQVPPPAFCRL